MLRAISMSGDRAECGRRAAPRPAMCSCCIPAAVSSRKGIAGPKPVPPPRGTRHRYIAETFKGAAASASRAILEKLRLETREAERTDSKSAAAQRIDRSDLTPISRTCPFRGDAAADPGEVGTYLMIIHRRWRLHARTRDIGNGSLSQTATCSAGRYGHHDQVDGALGADLAGMDVNAAETMLEIGHKCCVISEERATHGGHRH
jgi:hypothetical protein